MNRKTPLQRSPWGEKRRAAVRTEEGFYPTWERLLQLHGLDFWHNTISIRSQPGWPDYTVFGDGWLAFVELKARSVVTNRRGKLSPGQERYKASVVRGGGEWREFCLPDDWHEVDAWLNAHTNRGVWGWGSEAYAQALREGGR